MQSLSHSTRGPKSYEERPTASPVDWAEIRSQISKKSSSFAWLLYIYLHSYHSNSRLAIMHWEEQRLICMRRETVLLEGTQSFPLLTLPLLIHYANIPARSSAVRLIVTDPFLPSGPVKQFKTVYDSLHLWSEGVPCSSGLNLPRSVQSRLIVLVTSMSLQQCICSPWIMKVRVRCLCIRDQGGEDRYNDD